MQNGPKRELTTEQTKRFETLFVALVNKKTNLENIQGQLGQEYQQFLPYAQYRKASLSAKIHAKKAETLQSQSVQHSSEAAVVGARNGERRVEINRLNTEIAAHEGTIRNAEERKNQSREKAVTRMLKIIN